MFASTVLNDKPATVDDWQIRVPTWTPDIARTLVNISDAIVAAAGDARPAAQSAIRGVYHYSASERFTRWELVQAFARIMGRSEAHVTRLEGKPPGAPRPYDCQLNCDKLQATGLAAPCTPFEEGARLALAAAGVPV